MLQPQVKVFFFSAKQQSPSSVFYLNTKIYDVEVSFTKVSCIFLSTFYLMNKGI